jgi:pSer/pThr/pTyr-binding forkhead associated (FHA) protein
VEDLGSTNGTYVDGVRITGPRPVPPGMPIRVGKTTLELQA